MADTILQQLPQLEALCERLYQAQVSVRAHVAAGCRPVADAVLQIYMAQQPVCAACFAA